MQNLGKQLSKDQTEEYNKIKENCLGPNQQEAASLCLHYYLGYREAIRHISPDKIPLALKCAYFMAEKSQFTTDIKGQKIRGIAFSLNKLLKEHKLDDTMLMLKEMSKKVQMDDDTRTYLGNIVKEISFLITFHTKLEKTLQKLEIKERVSEACSYNKHFSSFAWLLFIQTKNNILKKSTEILPNTYILAHILSTLIYFSWDYARPEILKAKANDGSTEKEKKRAIKQKILEMFCIKDLREYGEVAQLFEEYFNHLLEKSIIRGSGNKNDFLSPQNLITNYKKLDRHYDKSINPQELDERIFFKERTLNLTPSKFTPFARQGYANKFQKPALSGKISGGVSKDQHFNSHRILNYQVIERDIDNKSVPAHDIKLPKTIMQSPSMVKVPLICSTPITASMEMYNYLKNKTRKFKEVHNHERSIDKHVFTLIDLVFDLNRKDYDKKGKQLKREMILPLYKITSEEYLASNPLQKDTTDLMKAFLALSIELVFFVSNISLSFQEIEEALQIQPLEMWKVIDYFLKSEKGIPSPLKLHLLDLQVNLISFKIWRNPDLVRQLSAIANKNHKEFTESQYCLAEKLFKRTLHQIAFQITRLTNLLNVQETTSQFIFDTMKETLSSCCDLLPNRHIDQLIICAIFANCKVDRYDIKFNDIKQCYEESNPNLKAIVHDIICNVYISESDLPKDVIKFYNEVYIQTDELKTYILNIRQSNGNTRNNNKKNAILMSPLKAIIPKEINFKSKNNPKLKGNMTPQTQLLIAYNESPIMKYEPQAFKGPLKSKKVLNYEEEEEKIKLTNKTFEDEPKTPEGNEVTKDFFNKRFNIGKKGGLKENQTNAPMNSHRSLFDATDKKETYGQHGEQSKQRTAKNYQYGIYR